MTSAAADLVGFDKLMWGSDYPRTMTAISYRMSLDFVEKPPGSRKNTKHCSLVKTQSIFMDLAIWQFRKNPEHGER